VIADHSKVVAEVAVSRVVVDAVVTVDAEEDVVVEAHMLRLVLLVIEKLRFLKQETTVPSIPVLIPGIDASLILMAQIIVLTIAQLLPVEDMALQEEVRPRVVEVVVPRDVAAVLKAEDLLTMPTRPMPLIRRIRTKGTSTKLRQMKAHSMKKLHLWRKNKHPHKLKKATVLKKPITLIITVTGMVTETISGQTTEI
jgi:hypothetical protein